MTIMYKFSVQEEITQIVPVIWWALAEGRAFRAHVHSSSARDPNPPINSKFRYATEERTHKSTVEAPLSFLIPSERCLDKPPLSHGFSLN